MTAREIDAIYRDGAHYDRLFGPGYVDFWLSRAKAAGGPVLEPGGQGRVRLTARSRYEPTAQIMRTTTLCKIVGESDRVGSLISRCTFRKSSRRSFTVAAYALPHVTAAMTQRLSMRERASRYSFASIRCRDYPGSEAGLTLMTTCPRLCSCCT